METQNDSLNPSDTEIVSQVLDGHVNAFETLLARYADLVHRLVRKHVPSQNVEETVQEAFVRAYMSLPSFREEGSFGQWLSCIVVRTCYDYWRKAYRSREVALSELSEQHQNWLEGVLAAGSVHALHRENARSEAAELLEWALSKLSAEDRMVLELVYLEGLSSREAGRLLGWSAANVKVRSFRSRRKLERIIMGIERREKG
ncbi:MAG: RNA polymerase sigma factor [Thermodesulfobacteriota bacterium]